MIDTYAYSFNRFSAIPDIKGEIPGRRKSTRVLIGGNEKEVSFLKLVKILFLPKSFL